MHPPGFVEGTDAHDLGESLAPCLTQACGGRLGRIDFFRSTHQHGGAATGFSTWREEGGASVPVMVKLPVGPVEHRWSLALGGNGDGVWDDARAQGCPVPRVFAAGTMLGGYDFAWLVVERLRLPLSPTHMDASQVRELLEAAADFQRQAVIANPTVEGHGKTPDWGALIHKGRQACHDDALPESQKWNDVLKKVEKALGVLKAKWDRRHVNAWCHGDLHAGNLMHRWREDGTVRRGVLIDLALVHPGHWVEDAVYLERQYWGHEAMLHGVKPVSELAHQRRQRGLPADGDYAELAAVRRVLMAASAPAMAYREGNHRYLHSAHEVLERNLHQAAH